MTSEAAISVGASPTASRALADTTTRTVTFENEGCSAVRHGDPVRLDPARSRYHPDQRAWHLCFSGYMVDAASGNPLVNRVGLVAPWLQNHELVEAVYGGPESVESLMSVGRAVEAKGGEIISAAGPEGAEGVLMPIGGYYHDPTRGVIPEYDNKWNQASWEDWLTYHPADHPQRLDKPLATPKGNPIHAQPRNPHAGTNPPRVCSARHTAATRGQCAASARNRPDDRPNHH